MGTLMEGFGGPLSGRVGPVVGYMWKSRACLRALPKHVNYPNTESQQRQRSWFTAMVRFASCAKDALRLGLREAADEASMTEGNYFVMHNKQHFHRVDGRVEVDYSQLRLAEGHAADVYFHEPKFEAGEVVSVQFEKNGLLGRASGDDRVYLFAYAPALASGVLSMPVERRSKRLALTVPGEWAGTVVHLYGFVVDRSGRASVSTYIGEGRINHYEDRSRYIKVDANWQEFIDMAAQNNGSQPTVTSVDHGDTGHTYGSDDVLPSPDTGPGFK